MNTFEQKAAIILFLFLHFIAAGAQSLVPFSTHKTKQTFGQEDIKNFVSPPRDYYPETWFHYIGGNVSKEGITEDLEAIANAGISGIQLFHGQFGGPWPGVEPQITSLSPKWDDAVLHTAEECRRLGLRFTMQNCPGWATSGGPWIEPSNAMRHLVWSRTDITGDARIDKLLSLPQPSEEAWRDYQDITVLAFPTPHGDTGEPLSPYSVKSNHEAEWPDYFAGKANKPIRFSPTTPDKPQWVEVTFTEPTIIRSVEFPPINSFNHPQCYDPGVNISIQAVLPDGEIKNILQSEMPQANSQDNRPITFACSEVPGADTYRISIVNKHPMDLSSLRLFSAARKNSWESEAGWTLRSLERTGALPKQSPAAFIDPEQILDISRQMNEEGRLTWIAPPGNWTILRIGHVNTGRRNSPAPPEGTGWECNKLDPAGANAQFAGYIGRLIGEDGPLDYGHLQGMLIDSWECHTQTWTKRMEEEFGLITGYPLRKWLPAVFGYVINDHRTTSRFLYDWRSTINNLFVNNFYGQMAKLTHKNGLLFTFETAAGDVFPADIMEYYKHADIPMCEFWQPMTEAFVGSNNFKPIKPAASATRLYGKDRLAAEAFTSFDLTWDEHLEMLKEVANVNSTEGVTHLVFHTYTHNPQKPFLPPGTSFGAGIGTPFLRGQTWWKFMPEFNTYLARCGYLLERGKPVSDILWYLGDEMNHKPNQNASFPEGFKYDYCNPDILLNRLSVRDGQLVTPEGVSYNILWLPDAPYMLPQTLKKIEDLIREGATVIGNAPIGLTTLSGGADAQRRFDATVAAIWGSVSGKSIRKLGRGRIISGMSLNDALKELNMTPDVSGGNALWAHRRADSTDWYFVTAPKGSNFRGILEFRCTGRVEIWDPVTGTVKPAESICTNNRTTVKLDLPRAGSCFVVFRQEVPTFHATVNDQYTVTNTLPLSDSWKVCFPSGWGISDTLELNQLKPWKDLDLSPEGKAFSGTATYTTTFNISKIKKGQRFLLDLGKVDMVAEVSVNGKPLRVLWAPPYSLDLTEAVKRGGNILEIKVTGTWFNRLVYDAGQPEEKRKTWTINGPGIDVPLRDSGLLGPVKIEIESKK